MKILFLLLALLVPAFGKDYRLHLGGHLFDPLEGVPKQLQRQQKQELSGPQLFLVQLQDSPQADWLQYLQKSGLSIVSYLPPHTYVVWGEMSTFSRRSQPAFVRWVGDFSPQFRIPSQTQLRQGSQQWHALLYRGVPFASFRAALVRLGASEIEMKTIDHRFRMVRFQLAGTRAATVPELRGLYSLQEEATDGGARGELSCQIVAGQWDLEGVVQPGYEAFLANLGLSGDGVIIANVDDGIDQTHPDLQARVGDCRGNTCGHGRMGTHGSHTAGIMAADGASGTRDDQSFLRGLGVAPGATLVEQTYIGYFTKPGGMLTLMTDSYKNGASLSGNSWGPSGSPLGYDHNTLQVDIGVRDADPLEPGNQPLSFVLSIMNGWGGVSRQGTPDEAKNIFAVGGSRSQNEFTLLQSDINAVAERSAHGPALDGRNLPHLVAPAEFVDSTRTATGYMLLAGTSMASPHVSGGIALFIEHYRHLKAVDPSPALVKAAILPMATSLVGNLDADGETLGHPFDSKQGWGRFYLAGFLDPDNEVLFYDQSHLLIQTNDSWRRTLVADDDTKPVRMMLVWTDAPGHGLGGSTPAWNNNLDLIVSQGEQNYYGNAFGENGWSSATGEPDEKNNTEGIFLESITGPFQVEVLARDLNSDGVPGEGNSTDQDFALVCYNCREVDSFEVSATKRTLSVAQTENQVTFEVSSSVIGDGAGPLNLQVTGLPEEAVVTLTPEAPVIGDTVHVQISNLTAITAEHYQLGLSMAQEAGLEQQMGLQLNVVPSLSPAPELNEPAVDAVEMGLHPEFSWTAVAHAERYIFELALDAEFEFMRLTESTTQTNLQPRVTLEPNQEYYWRVRADNAVGEGPYSSSGHFTTLVNAPILLVDDDDNSPSVFSEYTEALNQLGITYETHNTNNSTQEPSYEDLAAYPLVIWFSGSAHESTHPRSGPNGTGEDHLGYYLETGGRVIISAQDYLWDMGGLGADEPTDFMAEYVGIAGGNSFVSYEDVTGAGPLIAKGNLPLSFAFTNRSSSFTPVSTAKVLFEHSSEAVVISAERPYGRCVTAGFPLTGLGAGFQDILSSLIDFVNQPFSCFHRDRLNPRLPSWPEEQNILDLLTCE